MSRVGEEVLAVADGRTRPDIETRAGYVFRYANELRAAGSADRGFAVLRAAQWVHVLRYLDRTGETTFSRDHYGKPRWSLAGTFGTVRALQALFGRKPFTFYALPDADVR